MLKESRLDFILVIVIGFFLVLSFIVLKSIAPSVFPSYLIFVIISIISFYVFSKIDFDVLSLFSNHFYFVGVLLLLFTLIIGQVTRGVIRWIPLGKLSVQSAEIAKPFFLIFLANYIYKENITFKRFIKAILLSLLPLILVLIQPSLGIALLTAVGFLGVFLASSLKKKYFFYLAIFLLLITPLLWLILAPYQKARIYSFLNPFSDPLGKGYNSIQSVISVGSGGLFGRGLGKGVQTQLSFLPEKKTDFIFASISEELGFLGATLVIIGFFLILWRITLYITRAKSPQARAYLCGLFATLFTQMFIHVGMNMGLLPITGVPFPLISAGGSSLLATMTALGIALGTGKRVPS